MDVNLDNELIITILYDNKIFWRTFQSYKYYVMLQSISKNFKIDDIIKFRVLIDLGFDIDINYLTRKWILNMFTVKNPKYKKTTKASALFNYIRIKCDNSWTKKASILKDVSNRKYMLEKALECLYGLTIKDTYINLYGDVYNDISRLYMMNKSKMLPDECAHKLYKNLYYKRFTNYYDICEGMSLWLELEDKTNIENFVSKYFVKKIDFDNKHVYIDCNIREIVHLYRMDRWL